MESYSVEAILSAVDKNFTSTMNKADSSMGTLNKNSQNTNTSILDLSLIHIYSFPRILSSNDNLST